MYAGFEFDVFLSHSSLDKPVVRALAERLRADGVRVWFDEWEIPKGAPIPERVERGLEQSRQLLLVMSANAFASDWTALEAQSFRFRDPMNHSLRFLSLRLDDAPLKPSLAMFNYIDWRTPSEEAYRQLLQACGFAPHLPHALRGAVDFAALAHAWPHQRDALQVQFIDQTGQPCKQARCFAQAAKCDSFILRIDLQQAGQLALFCQSTTATGTSFVQLHPNPLSTARLTAQTLARAQYQLPGELCPLPDAALGLELTRLHFTEAGREAVLAIHAPQLPLQVRPRPLLHTLSEAQMREILYACWQTESASLAFCEVAVQRA